jgi:coproporphyrinogen III oxidase
MLTDTFLLELKEKFMDAISSCNQGKAFEKKEWDFLTKVGKIEVNVDRGHFFEKACVSNIVATVTIPGRDYKSTIQWVGVATHPSNPLVPQFRGVFEHVSEEGLEHCPAVYDIYPTIPFDQDKEYIRKQMAAVAEKNGKPYGDFGKGYAKMFQVKEVGSGMGYGVGIALGPEEDDFDYYREAATTIFDSYFHIADKRKDEKPSREQIDEMFRQRADLVRYTFMDNRFFQGGISMGVPPESFMLHNLPPVVKF